MSFYKLINSSNNIFAVATNFDFMRYQPNHISAYCSVDKAEYVNVDGEYYRAGWMRPTVKETKPADIIEITKDEYNILYEALKTDEEIPQEEPPIEEDIPEEPTEDMSLEQVRAVKLNQLSKICNQAITAGFDVVLTDGNVHHFSLSTNDQLNLITLSTMVASGEEYIPYHADGELCVFYPVQDVTAILNEATVFKTYHITYYNSLKNYVNSLSTIEEIGAVEYGMPIPPEYESVVMKQLFGN